jgi:hypothetical protein
VEHPFALSDADIDGTEDAPDTELFASNETRMRYRTMRVVAGRHARLRDNARVFLQAKGSPPPSPA